jgi:endogenous inhibitor of DNA gyrase (YacG/DUF329 family)
MTTVKCPSCGRQSEFEGNEFRPFCSERCKLLDFGAWADEKYTFPVEDAQPSEEDMAEIERVFREKEQNG